MLNIQSVYQRSFDKQKSGKFHSQSNAAVMDAFRWYIVDISILREALTARFIVKGNPEPLFVRRVGDIGSHAFLMYKPFNREHWNNPLVMPATVIFFLLIIISLFVAERKGYEGLYSFDKVTTLPLRGALALLILAHHLGQRTSIPIISDFTSHIGDPIVAIFFFISGYGLCVSYLSKGEDYLEGFLNRRLGKLLSKFILLTLGMMLITHFLGSVTLVQHAKYLVFEGITPLPYSWFILAILYIYITFYLCSFIVKKPALLGILFTITTLFYFVIMAKILHYSSRWYITILCVNLGYFTACYEKTITTIIEKNKVLCYSLIAIALVSTFGLKELYGKLFTPLWTMTQAFSLYIVIRTMRFIQWRWLRKIGILSLEIYLIHGIPIKIGQSLGLTNWASWAFAYSITIPSAILLNKIFDLLSQNKILYKLNMNRSN